MEQYVYRNYYCVFMAASHALLLDIGSQGLPGLGNYFIGTCVGAPQHNRTISSLRVDNKTPVASQEPLNFCLQGDFLYWYKYQ